jgi:hypothetical protein
MKGISPEIDLVSNPRTWILRNRRSKEKTYCIITTAILLLSACIKAGNYFTVTRL